MTKPSNKSPAVRRVPCGSAELTAPVTEAYIQGAVSAPRVGDALYPCRLPHSLKHLFPGPGDQLWGRARCASSVRLRMETDATSLALTFHPLAKPDDKVIPGHAFDLVVGNKIRRTALCHGGDTEVRFNKTGSGLHVLEVWLPPSCHVGLKSITARGATVLRPMPDRRPMWVTWGSSLTHCVRAGSASRTWPATVARRYDLNLVNMGFGGSCHLEPAVAMVIRDLPASFISMKLGINAINGSLSARTYPPLVAAAVAIIREKHPHTPIVLISPLANPPREKTPSTANYTLEAMRSDMESVHHAIVEAGDMNLYYVSGLDLFGIEDITKHAKDQLHPDAKGIDLQAVKFSQLVMPMLLGRQCFHHPTGLPAHQRNGMPRITFDWKAGYSEDRCGGFP